MSMYDRNHYNIVISLQLIKKIKKKFFNGIIKMEKNIYVYKNHSQFVALKTNKNQVVDRIWPRTIVWTPWPRNIRALWQRNLRFWNSSRNRATCLNWPLDYYRREIYFYFVWPGYFVSLSYWHILNSNPKHSLKVSATLKLNNC